MSKPPRNAANDQEEPAKGHQPPHEPERRRMSSLQRAFGGGVKKKPPIRKNLPQQIIEDRVEVPTLRRGVRRPTYEVQAAARAASGTSGFNKNRDPVHAEQLPPVEEAEFEEDDDYEFQEALDINEKESLGIPSGQLNTQQHVPGQYPTTSHAAVVAEPLSPPVERHKSFSGTHESPKKISYPSEEPLAYQTQGEVAHYESPRRYSPDTSVREFPETYYPEEEFIVSQPMPPSPERRHVSGATDVPSPKHSAGRGAAPSFGQNPISHSQRKSSAQGSFQTVIERPPTLKAASPEHTLAPEHKNEHGPQAAIEHSSVPLHVHSSSPRRTDGRVSFQTPHDRPHIVKASSLQQTNTQTPRPEHGHWSTPGFTSMPTNAHGSPKRTEGRVSFQSPHDRHMVKAVSTEQSNVQTQRHEEGPLSTPRYSSIIVGSPGRSAGQASFQTAISRSHTGKSASLEQYDTPTGRPDHDPQNMALHSSLPIHNQQPGAHSNTLHRASFFSADERSFAARASLGSGLFPDNPIGRPEHDPQNMALHSSLPIHHQQPGASSPHHASFFSANDRSFAARPSLGSGLFPGKRAPKYTNQSVQYSREEPHFPKLSHHGDEIRMQPQQHHIPEERLPSPPSFREPEEPLEEEPPYDFNAEGETTMESDRSLPPVPRRKSAKGSAPGSWRPGRRSAADHGVKRRVQSEGHRRSQGRSFGGLREENHQQYAPYSQSHSVPRVRHSVPSRARTISEGYNLSRLFGRSRSKRYSRFGAEDEEWDEEDGVRQIASVKFPILQDQEKEFHELVTVGDVGAVRRFLADNPGFNINCVSYQKTSALHVAIRDLNEKMIEELISHREMKVCDAVLTAVKVGDLHIFNTVLTALQDHHQGLEFAPCPDSAEFGDDVTPLMLAARDGKFEIVDLLLKRGHRMPDLHDPNCDCKQCRADLTRYDRLKFSTMKLNLYRAVASPMYLFQTTNDPILRAFELTGKLQICCRMYPQFKAEYEELWKELKQFTAKLIGCCRNAEEVELILKQPAGCEAAGQLIYPRLQLAIDLTQKEFVAHPNTQAVLESAWTGDWGSWKTRSTISQALAPVFRIPLLFVVFALSCCMPKNTMMASYNYPVNKFVSAYASYLVFLVVLFAQSTEDKKTQKRGPPASGWKYLIVLFVMGHIWSNIRLCFMLGPKRFFTIGWSWFDCAMQLCFLFTFVFWVAAWAVVMSNEDDELPRRFWDAYDPTLISEGLLVIATILAYLRLYLPISLNFYLGPLQISVGKMTVDIFRFVFIFALMILSWSVGMAHFYQYYDGMVQYDASSNSNTTQISSFVSFPLTLKTYFWAIFGMSPIESADVIIENVEGEDPGTTTVNTHQFTEGIGYFNFAMYQFLAVVVVLNMLVACMANTFTKVIDNVSVEWVFARTKIYLIYMYHSALPSPFNLVPTLSDLTTAFTWLTLLGKANDKTRAGCSFTHCCYIDRATEVSVSRDFPELMSQLAQRYLKLEIRESGGEEGPQESCKAEIQELKELITDLITIVNSNNASV